MIAPIAVVKPSESRSARKTSRMKTRPSVPPTTIPTTRPTAAPIARLRSHPRTPLSLCLADLLLEQSLCGGPVVVDNGVPRRVATLTAADEHVLAVDALECRTDL